MPWPTVSEVAESVEAGLSSEGDSTPEANDVDTSAAEDATTVPTEEPAATTQDAEDTTTTEAKTESPSDLIARLITEKGAAAFVAELPEDVREKIGPEVNKSWYTKLNQRDQEIRSLRTEMAAQTEAVREVVERKFDELLTSGMSEDDRRVFFEKKELERLRAESAKPKAPSSEDVQRAVTGSPVFREFWKTVSEAGLPSDPNDQRVQAIWQAGYYDADPATAITKMRNAAGQFVKKPEPKKEEDLTALIEKKASEIAERKLEERLKKSGLLSVDSGRPGAGGPTKTNPNDREALRRDVERMLRESATR